MRKKVKFLVLLLLLMNFTACTGQSETKKETEIQRDLSNHYVESEISLPESVYTVTSMNVDANDRIQIAGCDEQEQNSSIWEWDGANWSQGPDLYDLIRKEKPDFDLSGSLTVSISASDKILLLYDKDAEKQLFIIDDKSNIATNEYINQIMNQYAIASCKQMNENLFLLSDGMGKLLILDSEKETVIKLNAENEYTYAFQYMDGYLFLLTTQEMRVFNTKTMEEEQEHLSKTIMDEFMTGFSDYKINFTVENPEAEAVCYIADSDGVKRNSKTEETVLIDGLRTAFGQNDLSIDNLTVSGQSIFALMSKDNQSKLYRYEYVEKAKETEHEIKIFTLEENMGLSQAVNLYNQQHPADRVKIEIGMSDSISMSDALKQLNIELEAGSGPDILILDGLDVDAYIEKGLLEDISDIIIEKNEELLCDIMDTYKVEEKVYAVPSRFHGMYVASKNKEIVANSKELLTLFNGIELLEEDNSTSIMDAWSFNQVISILYRGTLTGKQISKEQIVAFYEEIQKLSEIVDLEEVTEETGRRLTDIENIPCGFGDFGLAVIGSNLVALDYISSSSDLKIVRSLVNEKLIEYSYLGVKDDNFYVPATITGISSKSENQETARAFISFLLSEEAQSIFDADGLPVNIKGIKNKITAYKEESYVATAEGGHVDDAEKKKPVSVKLQPMTEQDLEEIIREMKCFKIPIKEDGYIRNIILEEADNVLFNGADINVSAEKAANKIKIYENE